MVDRAYLDKEAVLRFSSIVEGAPYLVASDSAKSAGYTSMHSLKCASCQSQNCTSTRNPAAKGLERSFRG